MFFFLCFFLEQKTAYERRISDWSSDVCSSDLSYGSRATRPSILWGDVSRPAPLTVRWSSYAQSLTSLPVKGMLTGAVTILADATNLGLSRRPAARQGEIGRAVWRVRREQYGLNTGEGVHIRKIETNQIH